MSSKAPIRSKELLRHLRKKLKAASDEDAAKMLGLRAATLNYWRKDETKLSCLQVAGAIAQAHAAASRHVHENAVQPIVEFFPIHPVAVGKSADRQEVFATAKQAGKHLNGLREALISAKSGIYIFYDTRGRALYAGQTKRQNLWKEMNLAFNRDRSAQVVTLVNHPTSDVEFRPADRKVRQPTDKTLKLHNLARYFSAYRVVPEMVDDFEAFIIRAFPNDLLNFKMEKFGKPARKRAAVKKAKRVSKVAT